MKDMNSMFKDTGTGGVSGRKLGPLGKALVGAAVVTGVIVGAYAHSNKAVSENYGLGKLVDVSVKDERFYNARNEKDDCGNKMLREDVPAWGNLVSDLSLVNGVKDGGNLGSVIRKNGYVIKVPERYMNSKYGCK